MEVINLAGYTSEEKLKIAKQFLLSRQLEENGITKESLAISDEALLRIISQYTREAGVRNLEREIASVCRKVARKIAEEEKGPFHVSGLNLHKFLGAPKFLPEEELEVNETGVATGLAWTSAGGEILHVEATTMKGKGNLTLTGHLGDVMKESAQAALSYARSKAKELDLDPDFYEKLDLHIHVPAGAIPKDGPSAGVTMATSLISALTRIPVRKDIAMTGEITLRGRVLPIGGVKEKTLAALRAGIKNVIIPHQNQKDLDEIPPYIRRRVNFMFVKDMDEILKKALVPEKAQTMPEGAEREPGEKKGRSESVPLSLPV
jgi:ATP-dependent Lon protease